MELPSALRLAIDRALSGVPVDELAAAAAELSQAYRDPRREGNFNALKRAGVLAYLATRLPATYAAARAVFGAIAQTCPEFAPETLRDAGAGPGTVLWAAADCWESVADVALTEASPLFARVGQELAEGADLPRSAWDIADLAKGDIDGGERDLVTAAYVLNELAADVRPRVVEQLWRTTAQVLVIIEPGTPAGWQRILAARAQLIEAGGYVVAPCPHQFACPLQEPDWCHFSQRVARSRLHRQAKGADVPWEDEKFIYVAVSRMPRDISASRVIAHPRKAGGHVTLKLCRPDGTAQHEVVSRRQGERYKQARRADWGSLF